MEQTDITQRLHKLANRLLEAYEAIDLPTTFAEADRAAKALISISKAIKLTGEEAPALKVAPSPMPPRQPPVPSPYLAVERQAKALMEADRVLRGGQLSDAEIDALLGPP